MLFLTLSSFAQFVNKRLAEFTFIHKLERREKKKSLFLFYLKKQDVGGKA